MGLAITCFKFYSKPLSLIFFFVLKPNPITRISNKILARMPGILRNPTEIPIANIDSKANREYSTNTHLIFFTECSSK